MQSVLPNHQKPTYPIPPSIGQKLADLRGLISRFVVSQSLILVAIWLVSAFWVFGLIDYLPAKFGAAESPHAVRVVMLVLMGLVAGYVLYRFLWQLWKVRWTDSSLALLIENKHREFQSALITTVQAARPSTLVDSSMGEHPKRAGLLQLARDQATKLIETVEVNELVRFRPLQIQLTLLGILLAFSCVVAMTQPAWTYHWAQRFFTLADIPWPRSTELGVEGVELDVPTFTGKNARQRYLVPFREGIVAVPKGQSVQLKSWAKLTGKIVPEVCTVYYRDVAGNRGRANMRRLLAANEKQSFVLDGPPLESVNDSLWLSISGGDARISNLQLKSVEAPIITKLEMNVTYPEYLQRSTKTVWGKETIEYRTGTRLPQGSQLQCSLKTNKPISRCEFVVVRSGDSTDKAAQPEQSVEMDSSDDFQLPLGTLDGNVLMEVRLWDTDGICSTRVQQFVITAIADQPPQVDMVLQGIGTAITENAILPVAAKIKDDYDIQSAWLEAVNSDTPVFKNDVNVEPDGKVARQLDLKVLRDSNQLSAKVGSTLGLSLAAMDYSNLTSEPHVGKSSPIQLGVVTPDQLLIMLERREIAMRARLEQIIGELSQMRDLLINMQKAATKKPASELTEGDARDGSEESNDASESPESRQARLDRIQVLRSQQAAAQATKSEGELRGVEKEIHQIIQELINNRIDSADRRTRLEEKIRKPLLEVLDQAWPKLSGDIVTLEKSLAKSAAQADSLQLIGKAITKDNEIISQLTEILTNMDDIQDFNELVDMVRGLFDDQNKLIEKGKQEQKKDLLESLK